MLRAAAFGRGRADRRGTDAVAVQRVRGRDAGYLLRTWHPSSRPGELELDPGVEWKRLAVLDTEDGGLFDSTGTVSFRAIYSQDGRRGVMTETSRFVRQDKRWTYLGPMDE